MRPLQQHRELPAEDEVFDGEMGAGGEDRGRSRDGILRQPDDKVEELDDKVEELDRGAGRQRSGHPTTLANGRQEVNCEGGPAK